MFLIGWYIKYFLEMEKYLTGNVFGRFFIEKKQSNKQTNKELDSIFVDSLTVF